MARRSRLTLVAAAFLCAFLTGGRVVADAQAHDRASVRFAEAVSTPAALQEAVRSGKQHIVLNDHLDMTKTERFSMTAVPDSGVLAIVQNGFGQYTRSIRVRFLPLPITSK